MALLFRPLCRTVELLNRAGTKHDEWKARQLYYFLKETCQVFLNLTGLLDLGCSLLYFIS